MLLLIFIATIYRTKRCAKNFTYSVSFIYKKFVFVTCISFCLFVWLQTTQNLLHNRLNHKDIDF